MFKTANVSALLFVILVAGCASSQTPKSAAGVTDDKAPAVVYDY